MMAFFDRLRPARKVEIRREPVILGPVRQTSQQIRTAWDGAQVDNLLSGWVTGTTPINKEIEGELRTLRARSRQLAKNDPYVRRFLQLARHNTVGPTGFVLRSQVAKGNGKADKPARDAIERAWARAMEPGVICAKGRYSGLDFYNLASDQLARDGEVILLEERGGEFGAVFKFIDPELLDVNHKDQRPNGNSVRMGLETDKGGRVVAYHFHSTDSTNANYYTAHGRGYIRIPAEFVIHAFVTEYVDQLRGYPHTAAAMYRLRMLNGYEEAELVGARGGAATMGFVVRGENGNTFEGEQTIVSNDTNSLTVDQAADNAGTIEAEAGTFHYLEPGADVKMFDPNHPNNAYAAFIKAVLRGIASGLGVSYNTLANDLEGVNFSSIRSGVLEDREAWKARQVWMIESIVSPMFRRWLRAGLLSGAIAMDRGSRLASANYDKLVAHSFQGRRWQWVDPVKDIQANKAAIDERLRSRSDVIRELGGDPAEVWAEIAAENELLEELGVKPAAVAPAATPDDEGDENENEPGDEADEGNQ